MALSVRHLCSRSVLPAIDSGSVSFAATVPAAAVRNYSIVQLYQHWPCSRRRGAGRRLHAHSGEASAERLRTRLGGLEAGNQLAGDKLGKHRKPRGRSRINTLPDG